MTRARKRTAADLKLEALTEPTLPRFVELIRVSTKGQADRDTPELQRRALDRLRERRPGIPVERIEALGQSGAAPFDERPDLLRLLELAQAHAFDEVRVYAVDRLTRAYEADERWDIWKLVRKAGAVIVDANDNVIDPADRSGASEYRFFFEGQNAAAEHRKIGERTLAGRLRAVAQGKFPGGAVPYGLKWHKKASAWIELDDEIAVVREAFVWSEGGESLTQIAARLNANRVLRRPGRDGTPKWCAGCFGTALTWASSRFMSAANRSCCGPRRSSTQNSLSASRLRSPTVSTSRGARTRRMRRSCGAARRAVHAG
jgi:DNA invertase Pin-like site-specific DNA recombinase